MAGTIPANVEPESVRRDMRARRPSLVSALIHARAAERGARILSLLALDLVGIAGAIFTALAVKELVLDGSFSFDDVRHTTEEYVPFVFLVTALLFSRSGLYSRREARPGFAAIVAGLTLAAVAGLRLRDRERARLQLVLHLLRRAVLRPDLGQHAALGLRAR